jgi:flavin-dependent dehydrogenase
VVSQQKPQAYPLATAKRANIVSNVKVFKIGDAANITDPLTCEGIANAIFSGLYVTQAINMSTTLDSASENWQYLYQLYFEEDFDAALQIKSFRKFSFINKLLIWFMNRNKTFAEQVTYTFVGLIRYKKLFL